MELRRICGEFVQTEKLKGLIGSPQDVAEEVKQRIKFLAPGGGFIPGPSQDFLPDIPTENIVTMYEAARRYGRYPIRL